MVFILFSANLLAEHNHPNINQHSWPFAGDLLIFPDVTTISRIDQEPTRKLADNEIIPELNLFYTVDYGQFRFLGEWLVSTKTHNVERLQLGLRLGEESSLWLGRFHNPIGYWNMQYHHAAFLQTSISRPGIMAFETAGGLLPNHLTGFLFEGVHEFDKAGLYYTVGAGAGPDLNQGLSAFNIFEPGGAHRPGASVRLGYQPISFGPDEIGVAAAYTELPGVHSQPASIKQIIAGVYGIWQLATFNLLSEAIYVNNRLDAGNGAANHDFVNVYGQLAWSFHTDWTLYGRAEKTFNKNDDPYLALFPKYVEDRLLGGIRYQLSRHMILKLEGSEDHIRSDRFGQIMFQWSALFP